MGLVDQVRIGEHRPSNGMNSKTNSPTILSKTTVTNLPDKILLTIFGFMKLGDLCKLATVCKKWRQLAYEGKLWTRVSLRQDHCGLQVSNLDLLMSVIHHRFGNGLRFLELPAELITPTVLHEIANRCPNLKFLTLDFSNATQLHDFNDMNGFPCNLRQLAIFLSEVIFMEGFMRKVYQSLSSVEVLHLIGTFELGDDECEETYEVINIGKIKAHTPNLRVINFYGISFLDDGHVELLSNNCIHLQCLALNYCLKVKGSSLKHLLVKCRKLKCLLLQHCSLESESVEAVDWEKSSVQELDISSTELSARCLEAMFCNSNKYTHLAAAHCEFLSDQILNTMLERGKLDEIKALDLSYTVNVSETVIERIVKTRGRNLQGMLLYGKPKLAENFYLNIIPFMKNIKVLGCGASNGWFLRMTTRIHIDQMIICLSQHCHKLLRLEFQWDPETIRTSDNSNKFIDILRMRCPVLRSLTMSDGEYYEMVKSNFERSDRHNVVRTATTYNTSIVSLLDHYKDLLFN